MTTHLCSTADGPVPPTPFDSGATASKPKVALMIAGYMGGGFLIPFIAAKWTLNKNGLSNKWCDPFAFERLPPCCSSFVVMHVATSFSQ